MVRIVDLEDMDASQLWSELDQFKLALELDDTPSFLAPSKDCKSFGQMCAIGQKRANLVSPSQGMLDNIDCTPIQKLHIEDDCTPCQLLGDTPRTKEFKMSFLTKLTSFEKQPEASLDSGRANMSLNKPGFSEPMRLLSSLKLAGLNSFAGSDSNPTRSTLRDSAGCLLGASCEAEDTIGSLQKDSERKQPKLQRKNSKKGPCLGLNIYGMKNTLASCDFIQLADKVECEKAKPILKKQPSSERTIQQSPNRKLSGSFKSEKCIKRPAPRNSLNPQKKKAIGNTLDDLLLIKNETDMPFPLPSLKSDLNLIEKFSLPLSKLNTADLRPKLLKANSSCDQNCNAGQATLPDSQKPSLKSVKADYKCITLDSILKRPSIRS